MAKLPRTTQKIFGKNAPENQITTFGSIKAGTPVYTQSASQIMNSAFEGGWSEAVEDDYAPYRQDRNAVDTAITQQLGYLFQDGIPEWDAGTTYYKGGVVKVVNGNALTFYKSIADNNTASVNTTASWHKMLEINASNQIVSPSINTPTISGGSMSNGTFANPTFSGTVNVPLASKSSSTDSTIAASIGWVNNPSLSSNVVHKTGDESIAGTKTFTDNIVSTANNNSLQHNIAKGTNPSSNLNKMLWFKDNTSAISVNSQNCFGFIQQSVFSSGGTEIRLASLKNVENGTQQAALRVIYNTNGKYQLLFQGFNNTSETNDSLSAVQDSTTSIVVPTMGWVNNPATSTNVVHRTGSETINGTKTHTADIQYKNSSADFTAQSTTDEYWVGPRFVDKNNVQGGSYQYMRHTNGSAECNIQTRALSTNSFTKIAVHQNADGTGYTEAPTPTDTDTTTGTQIATTGWVNSRLNTVMKTSGAGLATFEKDKNGYIKFANGIIMQWGEVSGGNTDTTVTFPTAFTSYDSYSVSVQNIKADNSELYAANIGNRQSTYFHLFSRGGAQNVGKRWIAIGY